MDTVSNEFGQPIGSPLERWTQPPLPPAIILSGDYCRLEPLDVSRHGGALSEAWISGVEERDWTYLPFGPFHDKKEAAKWVHDWSGNDHFSYYAIVGNTCETATGVASYLRMDPQNGCIEIGGILFSRRLMRTAAATEAIFLLLKHVFALGYRRCEWKCDALNEPSRRAAIRLGFTFEGIFRQATMVKGRNRDTAWYAMTDKDWSVLRPVFLQWLDRANFDESGCQIASLSHLVSRK